MMWPLVILVGTQLIFSVSDLMGRHYMKQHGFTAEAFLSGWFLVYFVIRQVATIGQLYVFTAVDLGRTMALFGAASIIISNVLGLLVLKEVLSPGAYVGVSLVVIAFLMLAFTK